jgi:hypothetical protein
MGQLGLAKTIASAALVLVLGVPDECWARGHGDDESGESEVADDDDLGDDDEAPGDAADAESGSSLAAAMAPDAADPESTSAGSSDPHAWSFGPYLRYVVVPSFMIELFVDLAPNVTNAAFGATARHRTKPGGPMIDFGIGYASYAFTGAFRSKGGTEGDTEWVESSLGLVHLTGSIIWDTPISSQFAFEYGVGLDFGFITGEFKRTEAYGSPAGYGKCTGVGLPSPEYCAAPITPGAPTDPYNVKGEQYNVVDESVPAVIGLPMLPRLAIRYQPLPELAIRVEGAYGLVQVWLGLAVAYSPEL